MCAEAYLVLDFFALFAARAMGVADGMYHLRNLEGAIGNIG